MDIIVVDIETVDPNLKSLGPGTIRKDGYIIGVGIYAPHLGIHEFYRTEDPELADILARPEPKVFHNAVYDTDWLVVCYEYELNGRIEDTMTRAVLLDSYQMSYSLDNCCKRAGIAGKNKGETIDEYYKRMGFKGKAIENLDKIPFDIVGMYCKQDCKATYDLYMWQEPHMEEEGLLPAYEIECGIYPWLLDCRKHGTKISWTEIDRVSAMLRSRLQDLEEQTYAKYGRFNVNSGNSIAEVFKREGIPIQYTDTGHPSFTKDVLNDIGNELTDAILKIRSDGKLLNTFLDGNFRTMSVGDRMYSCLYPMKRDGNGTITGRFSSANINMQNIPARTAETAHLIRGLFLPDDGCYLAAFDYSQIEYRLFCHFAIGDGADEIRYKYKQNPLLDFHRSNQEMVGWTSPDHDKDKELRMLTKNLGFGILYGLQPKSFAAHFKRMLMSSHPDVTDMEQLIRLTKEIFEEFHNKVPYMQYTAQKIQEVAKHRGYILSLAKRRIRTPPAVHRNDGEMIPYFKLVNFLCQGSAADIVKKAIYDSVKAGVWSTLHAHTMVHDEIVFSIPQTKEGAEAAIEMHRCMKNSYDDRLTIPLHVDTEIGTNWGNCDEDTWNDFIGRYK